MPKLQVIVKQGSVNPCRGVHDQHLLDRGAQRRPQDAGEEEASALGAWLRKSSSGWLGSIPAAKIRRRPPPRRGKHAGGRQRGQLRRR